MQVATGNFQGETYDKNGQLMDENGIKIFYCSGSCRPISRSSNYQGGYGVYSGDRNVYGRKTNLKALCDKKTSQFKSPSHCYTIKRKLALSPVACCDFICPQKNR